MAYITVYIHFEVWIMLSLRDFTWSRFLHLLLSL